MKEVLQSTNWIEKMKVAPAFYWHTHKQKGANMKQLEAMKIANKKSQGLIMNDDKRWQRNRKTKSKEKQKKAMQELNKKKWEN